MGLVVVVVRASSVPGLGEWFDDLVMYHFWRWRGTIRCNLSLFFWKNGVRFSLGWLVGGG